MACHKALSVVACSFEFTNVADEDLYILTSDTPLEGPDSPFVAVYHEGHRIDYKGILGFRLPPTKENFLLLKAGQSISATVQISDVFTFSTDGIYNIRYNKPLKFVTSNQMIDAGYIQEVSELEVSESIYIYLEDTHNLIHPVRPSTPKPDYTVHVEGCSSANFVGANATEVSQVTAVHKKLCDGFKDAYNRVGKNALTKTWFGNESSTRDTTAKGVLKKCEDGIRGTSVTYDYINGQAYCQYKPGTIAHTSFESTTVFLCNSFNKLAEYCGYKFSKERSLAHEWTHAFANTKDHKYWPADCKELARDEPAKALENADNYALFYCKGWE